jgi:hypothetical protein
MGNVVIDMSMSLDGYIAAPNDNPEQGLLGGGRRLFDQLPQRVELERTGLSETGGVTHLDYRVVR